MLNNTEWICLAYLPDKQSKDRFNMKMPFVGIRVKSGNMGGLKLNLIELRLF